MADLKTYILLAIGGAAGTIARFGIGEWFKSYKWNDSFPWHTLTVNLVGSFFLGFVAVLCKQKPTLALLLGTGFCGGLTTFSTFCLEGIQLISEQKYASSAFYLLGSVVFGLLGVFLAMQISQRVV